MLAVGALVLSGLTALDVTLAARPAQAATPAAWPSPQPAKTAVPPPAAAPNYENVPGPYDDTDDAKQQAKATKTKVEILAKRTESATTYATPEGKLMTSFAAEPVRVRQGGQWVPVDTTLVATAGHLSSRATKGALALSAGVTVAGAAVASLDDNAGHAVSLNWPTALPAPSVAGDTATYRGVGSDADLSIRATASGFEQSVVLNSRPTVAPVIRLPLGGHGYTAKASADGGFDLLDAADSTTVVGRISPAVMFGSEVGANSGEPTRSATVASSLVTTAGGQELRLSPDLAFLADPGVRYPVKIDPFVQIGQTGHTYIDSGFNTGNPSDWLAKIGTYNGGANVNRSLFSFNWGGLRSAGIASATFWIYENWSWSCSPSWAELWDTGYFDGGTRWSTAPPPYTWWASQNVAFGYSSGCGSNWVGFDATRLAQAWSNGGYGTTYAMLKAPNEVDNNQWKKFDANSAHFDVTYADPGCTYYSQTGYEVCGAIRDHYNAVGVLPRWATRPPTSRSPRTPSAGTTTSRMVRPSTGRRLPGLKPSSARSGIGGPRSAGRPAIWAIRPATSTTRRAAGSRTSSVARFTGTPLPVRWSTRPGL
jgi:hypothetical protein